MKHSILILGAAGALAASLAAAPSFALTQADLLGEQAAGIADRVVQLDGSARALNVDQGETVQFVSNGKSFQWLFDGTYNRVKLSQIAPSDFTAPDVPIYVNQTVSPLTESAGGAGD